MSLPPPEISLDPSRPIMTAFHFIYKQVVTEEDQGSEFPLAASFT